MSSEVRYLGDSLYVNLGGLVFNEIRYFGDGLYAKFDGHMVILMANSHSDPTDTVALEPQVLDKFVLYASELKEFIAQQRNMEKQP